VCRNTIIACNKEINEMEWMDAGVNLAFAYFLDSKLAFVKIKYQIFIN